jgi:hypothetical protein
LEIDPVQSEDRNFQYISMICVNQGEEKGVFSSSMGSVKEISQSIIISSFFVVSWVVAFYIFYCRVAKNHS